MYVIYKLSMKKTQKKKIDFSKFTKIYHKQKNKMSNNTYEIALTIENAKKYNMLDDVPYKILKNLCEDDLIFGTADFDYWSNGIRRKDENEVMIKLKIHKEINGIQIEEAVEVIFTKKYFQDSEFCNQLENEFVLDEK